MSERYLVMPRGINVGTRNRVPMAELRSKLTGDGYWDVATVLQSGNVIASAEVDRPGEVAGRHSAVASRRVRCRRCLRRANGEPGSDGA